MYDTVYCVQEAGLVTAHHWNTVVDFRWHKNTHSPNWYEIPGATAAGVAAGHSHNEDQAGSAAGASVAEVHGSGGGSAAADGGEHNAVQEAAAKMGTAQGVEADDDEF